MRALNGILNRIHTELTLSLGHMRSRDHRIARLVTNLRDVRLVTTTKDQSLRFIYGLPLMLFGTRNIFKKDIQRHSKENIHLKCCNCKIFYAQ